MTTGKTVLAFFYIALQNKHMFKFITTVKLIKKDFNEVVLVKWTHSS